MSLVLSGLFVHARTSHDGTPRRDLPQDALLRPRGGGLVAFKLSVNNSRNSTWPGCETVAVASAVRFPISGSQIAPVWQVPASAEIESPPPTMSGRAKFWATGELGQKPLLNPWTRNPRRGAVSRMY